jgi:hypothetical protein
MRQTTTATLEGLGIPLLLRLSPWSAEVYFLSPVCHPFFFFLSVLHRSNFHTYFEYVTLNEDAILNIIEPQSR